MHTTKIFFQADWSWVWYWMASAHALGSVLINVFLPRKKQLALHLPSEDQYSVYSDQTLLAQTDIRSAQ